MSGIDNTPSMARLDSEIGTPPDVDPADALAAAPLSLKKHKTYLKKFKEPDSDEEIGDLRNLYNIQESWRTLMNLPSCQKIMVS